MPDPARTLLSGVTEQRPRWKRGVSVTEGALGEAVGKLYVGEHFPADRKALHDLWYRDCRRPGCPEHVVQLFQSSHSYFSALLFVFAFALRTLADAAAAFFARAWR